MDETYIKIKGRWHYLYRAIDADGLTLDIWLRKKRDTQAAYAFLKRLHKQFGQPRVIVTDKAPSIGSAFRKLQRNGLYTKTEHRTMKYLNNLIEQDHRPIKRRNKFYRSLRTASSTIKGMETIRGIYIKNRRNGIWLWPWNKVKSNRVIWGSTRWSWNVIKHKSHPCEFLPEAEVNPSTWKTRRGDFFYTSRFFWQ